MDADRRHAHGGGDVLGSAVIADIQRAGGQQPGQIAQRHLPRGRGDPVRTRDTLQDRGGDLPVVLAADQQHRDIVPLDQQGDQAGHVRLGPLLGEVTGAGVDGDDWAGEQRPRVCRQFLPRHRRGSRVDQLAAGLARRVDRRHQMQQIAGDVVALVLQRLVALPFQGDVEPGVAVQRIVSRQKPRAGVAQDGAGGHVLAEIHRDVEPVRRQTRGQGGQLLRRQREFPQLRAGVEERERDAFVDRGLRGRERQRGGGGQHGQTRRREQGFQAPHGRQGGDEIADVVELDDQDAFDVLAAD